MQNRIGQPLGAAFAIASAALLFSCIDADDQTAPDESELRSYVEPKQVDGNPKCEDLDPHYQQVFFDSPKNGEKTNDEVTINVTNRTFVDWASTRNINVVIVKGGKLGANVYYYKPPKDGDSYLTTPTEQEISHISFCYKPSLKVSKTADTSFKRKWKWAIDKQLVYPAYSKLLLKLWEWFLLKYEISVYAESEKSDFRVNGKIAAYNPNSIAATITKVEDHISGFDGPVYVNCGVTFPYTLAPYQTLYCDYHATLPDGYHRTNTATVSTKGKVDGGSATADVKFSDTPHEEIDECVDVYARTASTSSRSSSARSAEWTRPSTPRSTTRPSSASRRPSRTLPGCRPRTRRRSRRTTRSSMSTSPASTAAR